MSEFKAIETQEEFDKVIGERLKREQETVRKEYEGFLSPEDVQKKYEADVIGFAGHKTLCGPFGIGGFIIRKDVSLKCILTGGTGSGKRCNNQKI